MDFGKLPENELDHIDFALPPDPEVNAAILKNGKGNTKFHIGCARIGRKEWVGKYYPKSTKEKDFLTRYAQQFNTIEFNGFFYNLHSRQQVEKWAAMVPDDFLFCPKFTQSITHFRRLKNVSNEVDAFLEVIEAFKGNLGPAFLMPHPQMGVSKRNDIQDFVADMPIDISLFIELRHEDWYDHENGYDQALFDFMVQLKRGLIITDTAGRRDCVHMHLSTPECFIRFVGNGLHPTDYSRIDAWVQRIKQWMDQGLEKCYFFMHQHEELHSPELIKYFIQQLNKHAGTNIPLPKIYDDVMPTLF